MYLISFSPMSHFPLDRGRGAAEERGLHTRRFRVDHLRLDGNVVLLGTRAAPAHISELLTLLT
jgi:hypothetical protein